MTRRTTRLTIDIGGAPKQALKIKEHGHGTLTITCQVGRNFEDGDENRPISDDHYSIHPPDKGQGVLMKRTTRLVDGAKIELATFVHMDRGAMVSPIFAKYSQNLNLPQYDLRAGRADRVVSLGTLDPSQQSFLFAVIVSTSDWPMELMRPPHLDFMVIPFARFTVGIVYSAIGFPSSDYGRYAHLLTSSPRVDGGEYVQLDPLRRMLTPSEVASLVTMMLESVGKRQFERLAALLPPSENFNKWQPLSAYRPRRLVRRPRRRDPRPETRPGNSDRWGRAGPSPRWRAAVIPRRRAAPRASEPQARRWK